MLTKTEQAAISLLTASHTQKDIADKLNIVLNSLDTQKLNLKSYYLQKELDITNTITYLYALL